MCSNVHLDTVDYTELEGDEKKQTEFMQLKFWTTYVTWCSQRLDKCPLCRAGLKAAIRAKREAGEEV